MESLTKMVTIYFFVFRTLRASTLPLAEQAVSGSDYVATQGSVNMADTVTRATIQFTIKQVSYVHKSANSMMTLNKMY